MKKYLLALTVGLVALVGTACSTAPTAAVTTVTTDAKFDGPAGTVEDRRTTITVSPSLTAPSTTEAVPTTTDGPVYASAATLGNDPAFLDWVSILVDDADNVMAAIDDGDIPALMAACQTRYDDALEFGIALNVAYTGPLVADITWALATQMTADEYCAAGDFEMAATVLEMANTAWEAVDLDLDLS